MNSTTYNVSFYSKENYVLNINDLSKYRALKPTIFLTSMRKKIKSDFTFAYLRCETNPAILLLHLDS
jgi:hypothetical protein